MEAPRRPISEMSVLIAGCGYVGGRLARLLVEAGAGVFALSRRPAVLPGVSPVRADLASRGSLIDLPSAFDAIVFCAGPSSHDERGYREIFVDGLSNLIEVAAAMRQPPDRLIFASSTAVYGQSHGEWVDEASSTRPLRFNGEVLLEAESLLHDAPFAGCALRLGGIYGPGRTRRIEQVRAGQVRLDPGGPHYTNRIHLEDAARSLLHLLAAPALEPVYLGVDDEPADDNDVLRFLAGELGLPDPPVAASAVARRSGSKRCRNDRLKASGYRLAYPTYREGYRAVLARD